MKRPKNPVVPSDLRAGSERLPTDRGVKAHNWKGGRRISRYGYVFLFCPEHPNCNNVGYVNEHRLVMERHIGRFLISKEVVHHKDQNKQNNSIDNLQLFASESEHQSTIPHRYGYFVTRGKEGEYHKDYLRQYKRKQSRKYLKTGQKHGLSKLTFREYEEIRSAYSPRVVTFDSLAKKYGVGATTIKRIVKSPDYGIIGRNRENVLQMEEVAKALNLKVGEFEVV